jgi:hypothetical protein
VDALARLPAAFRVVLRARAEAADLRAAPFLAPFSFPARGGFFADLRRALPFGVFAAAVFRLPPRAAVVARRPVPAFLRDGLSFVPLLFLFVLAMAVQFSGRPRAAPALDSNAGFD